MRQACPVPRKPSKMPREILFWVLVLLWAACGLFDLKGWKAHAPGLLMIAIVVMLGWKCYGPAVK